LFERFKKGDPGGDSIGIGLAIVRQICDLGHFTVDYRYGAGIHSVAVGFTGRMPASNLLQNLSLAL
jgi:signal transduction histidine kinase